MLELYNKIDVFLYYHPLVSLVVNLLFLTLLAATINFIRGFTWTNAQETITKNSKTE